MLCTLQVAVKFVEKKRVLDWVKVTHSLRNVQGGPIKPDQSVPLPQFERCRRPYLLGLSVRACLYMIIYWNFVNKVSSEQFVGISPNSQKKSIAWKTTLLEIRKVTLAFYRHVYGRHLGLQKCSPLYGAKCGKEADSDPSGKPKHFNRFWWNLACSTMSGTPHRMTTLVWIALRAMAHLRLCQIYSEPK